MKKYLRIMLVSILSIGIMFSCKKSSSPAPAPIPKDYTASIKDKTWWGQLTYTGKTPEYYSVHFNADNSMLWSEFSGDYTGHWAVSNNELTMVFDFSGAKIIAGISEDNVLQNINDNTGAYEVNNGVLIATPDIPLDNTVWKGSRIINVPNTPITSQPMQMSFIAGTDVRIQFSTVNGTTTIKYNYIRPAPGAVRASSSYSTNVYFGVITSDGGMKGTIDNSDNTWQVTKQ